MKLERVAEAVQGVPVMSPEQGRIIYDHILMAGVVDVLELGTASGVSAAYMAAALEERREGHITTVDRADLAANFSPTPEEVLDRAGLREWVTIVRPSDSSYNWFLKQQVERHSDKDGNCTPVYDFCYLDGAHNFTIDGLATILIERLLRPGGWLLLDDLDWTYARGSVGEDFVLSESERREPHMLAIFDVILKQHPSFTEFRVQDGAWGWAKKDPAGRRSYSLDTTSSLSAIALNQARKIRRRLVR